MYLAVSHLLLLGVALLPLIMYHLWQLTVARFLPRLLGPVDEPEQQPTLIR